MSEFERRRRQAETHLKLQMMKEMSEVMRRTGLPPMAVMREAARAVGHIYRETAEAHCEPSCCPCGWCPQEAMDLEHLGEALREASRSSRSTHLSVMQVLGRA
ncbi:hypothetical protein ABWH97_07890 [Nitratireductor sp. ac15]